MQRLRWLWHCCGYLCLTLFTLAFLARNLHLQPPMPGSKGDQSWVETFVVMFLQGRVWGRDVVFMYGPLSFLYTQQFHPALFAWTIAFNTCCVLGVVVALHLVGGRRWPLTLLLAGLWILTAPSNRDSLLFLLPLFTALLYAGRWPLARGLWPLLLALTVIAGFAKFSLLLAGLVVLLPVDLLLVLSRQRRLPWATLGFLVGLPLCQVAIGQPLAALPDFIASSLAITQGYALDESLAGPVGWGVWERVAFLALAGSLSLAQALRVFWTWRRRQPVDALQLALLAAVPATSFLLWKAGFVRHDGHAQIAWAGLSYVGVTVIAATLADWRRWPLPALALLVALVASVASGLSITAHNNSSAAAFNLSNRLRQIGGSSQELLAFAADPAAAVEALRQQRLTALREIRAQYPLPDLPGSVEVVPLPASIVTANDLDYDPRPTYGYAALAPELLANNLAHIEGPPGPQWIYWQSLTTDRGYPGIDDANLVPAILRYYDPINLVAGLLQLQRRAQPRQVEQQDRGEVTLANGTWVALPQDGLALWGTLDAPLTTFGQFLAVVWHPPILSIELELASGKRHRYRLPTIAAHAGFQLTPLLASNYDLLQLFAGRVSEQAAQRVIQVRLLAPEGAAAAFVLPARLHLATLAVAGAAEHPPGATLASTDVILALFQSYLAGSTPYPPGIDPDLRLRAHAPSMLTISGKRLAELLGQQPLGALRLRFGLDNGAWQGGNRTDGVCFSVAEQRGGQESQLFQRCLDPLHRAEDRNEQAADIALSGGLPDRYIFRTDPGTSLQWDWAYWSHVAFE